MDFFILLDRTGQVTKGQVWFSKSNSKIRTNVLLVIIFENAQKKVIDCQKRHLGRFWLLITFFCALSQKNLSNNICASIVFKAKAKEKYEEKNCFTVFFQNSKKNLFWGSINFFSVLAFKTIDTQLLFWYVFLKTHKKNLY